MTVYFPHEGRTSQRLFLAGCQKNGLYLRGQPTIGKRHTGLIVEIRDLSEPADQGNSLSLRRMMRQQPLKYVYRHVLKVPC